MANTSGPGVMPGLDTEMQGVKVAESLTSPGGLNADPHSSHHDVVATTDAATTLKQQESASPGPIGHDSLAARVHEAALSSSPTLKVTTGDMHKIQEAESKAVHSREAASSDHVAGGALGSFP